MFERLILNSSSVLIEWCNCKHHREALLFLLACCCMIISKKNASLGTRSVYNSTKIFGLKTNTWQFLSKLISFRLSVWMACLWIQKFENMLLRNLFPSFFLIEWIKLVTHIGLSSYFCAMKKYGANLFTTHLPRNKMKRDSHFLLVFFPAEIILQLSILLQYLVGLIWVD